MNSDPLRSLLVDKTLKKDLREDEEARRILNEKNLNPISYEQGANKTSELGAFKYLECSSLTGEGVKEVIEEVLKYVSTHEPVKVTKRCTVM